MSDPVTWLDVLIVLAVYLVACVLHKLVTGLLAARARFDELTETGDEAAPERPDDAPAEPTRAVCTPAASSPLDELRQMDRERLDRWRRY